MAVKFPQVDTRPRGFAADADGLAGEINDLDFFEAAAAADGGHTSAVFLNPFGLGVATAATLDLAQSGAIAITGAPTLSGDISFKLNLSQSGQVSISGAPALTGDIFTRVPLDLAQSGQIAISGAPLLSGDIGLKFNISQSGALAISGAPTLAGDLGFKWELAPFGDIAVSGSASLSGDIAATVYGFRSAVFLNPYGFGADTPGALDLTQSGVITISGAPSLTGDIAFKLDIIQSGQVAISGAPSLSGDIEPRVEFEFEPPLEVSIASTLSLVGDLGITGAGSGLRSAAFLNPYGLGVPAAGPFGLVQSGAIAISGTPSLVGDVEPVVEFPFEAPLELSAAGTVAVSGDIEITGSLLDGFSSPVFLNPYGLGVPVVGGPFSLVQSGAIAISGAPTLAGDIEPVVEFPLEPPIPLDASGVLAVSGDVQITAVTNLVQSGALALAGVLSASGNIQINTGSPATGGPLPWVRRRRRM